MYFDDWNASVSASCCASMLVNSASISRFCLSCFLLRLVLLDDGLRRERILVVFGVEEDAGERVVVLGRNRVVLVVVTAGAADGQAEHAAADGIDAIVALVGVRDLDGAVVVVPRPEAEEAQRRQMPHALRPVEQIGGELRGRRTGRTAGRR